MLTSWPKALHRKKEQKQKFLNALTQTFDLKEYNAEESSALIKSSSQTDTWYHTSLQRCDCKDNTIRHVPCKHMYYLDLYISFHPYLDYLSEYKNG